MRYWSKKTIMLIIGTLYSVVLTAQSNEWKFNTETFSFNWDLEQDEAAAYAEGNSIWKGSLLPAFWVKTKDAKPEYVKADFEPETSEIKASELKISFGLGSLGKGVLNVKTEGSRIRFSHLEITWYEEPPAIIEMYFGTRSLTKEQMAMVTHTKRPFYPDWSAYGYCVPGAKEGPAQSYFRSWDFGQSEIALGSFGPSMGTLYAAAFPRPIYMAAMGNNNGWVSFAAGSIPDAPMSLQIRSTHGCFKYVYREDKWEAASDKKRTWQEPLHINFGKNAYEAFKNYMFYYPAKDGANNKHHKAIWNTWGNWKNKEYAIKPIADFAEKVSAEILVLDDPWETFQGSGEYSKERFPNFLKDIEYINGLGMENGIWETLAWIDDPEAAGLTHDDLMLDENGVPAKGSWNFNPYGGHHYILDLSSELSRKFLVERTKRVMKTLDPTLLKLDFGYGIPNPNVAVPRDPGLRGERYAYYLTKTIVEAAKEVKPNITVMYYGISPLFRNLTDMVSLDDQGDLWYEQASGHAQWSLWASLLSAHNIALNGSSSYDWSTDDETILNTVILGSPGSVLPNHIEGDPVPDRYMNRRYAINKWYRKTTLWKPIWYNSNLGGMHHAVEINCWGRSENINGDSVTTALVLREITDADPEENLPKGYNWTGNWALISQTGQDIKEADELAVIPFENNSMISLPYKKKPQSVKKVSYNNSVKYNDWQWDGKILKINLDGTTLSNTAGFIIQTK